MGVGLGLVGFLGYGQESVYGTPIARTNFLEINEESIGVEEPQIESGALAAVGIRNTKSVQGGVSVAGDFGFDAQYAGWERLLKHLMGSISSSRPDVTSYPTVWDHTFDIANSLPTGLTLEVYRATEDFVTEPSKSFIYDGCLISAGSFSCGVDDLLKCRFTVIGHNEARGSKSTPSYNTSKLAVYHQGIIKWNANDVEVSNFTIDIANTLEGRPKLGSRYTRQPKRSGKLTVSGTFQAEFTSWAEYDDFRAATERVFNAQFIGDVIGGTYYNQITFNLPVAKIVSHKVVLNSPGRLIMEVNFKAYRTDSANELTVVMRNITTASLAG